MARGTGACTKTATARTRRGAAPTVLLFPPTPGVEAEFDFFASAIEKEKLLYPVDASNSLPTESELEAAEFDALLEERVNDLEESGFPAGENDDVPAQCEALVGLWLKHHFENRVFRQHEWLNGLFGANLTKETLRQRHTLMGSATMRELLDQNKSTIRGWSSKPIGPKKGDTADWIVSGRADLAMPMNIHILDVKSHDINKKSRGGNVISSRKLANACRAALEGGGDLPQIYYVVVSYDRTDDGSWGVCRKATICRLLKVPPENLTFNFTAGKQLQDHMEELPQTFTGTPAEWAANYLILWDAAYEKYVKSCEDERISYASAVARAAALLQVAAPEKASRGPKKERPLGVEPMQDPDKPWRKPASATSGPVVPDRLDPDVVHPDSQVEFTVADGEKQQFRIVDSPDAAFDSGLLSLESPVAQAMVGHRAGETVSVMTPAGARELRILAVTA